MHGSKEVNCTFPLTSMLPLLWKWLVYPRPHLVCTSMVFYTAIPRLPTDSGPQAWNIPPPKSAFQTSQNWRGNMSTHCLKLSQHTMTARGSMPITTGPITPSILLWRLYHFMPPTTVSTLVICFIVAISSPMEMKKHSTSKPSVAVVLEAAYG